MRNRFVLKCTDWENWTEPVYISSLVYNKQGDLETFVITPIIEVAKRFSYKKACEVSQEIYDSYCDDFEVINTTEIKDGSK